MAKTTSLLSTFAPSLDINVTTVVNSVSIFSNMTSPNTTVLPGNTTTQALSVTLPANVTCFLNSTLNVTSCNNGTDAADGSGLFHPLWLTIVLGLLAIVVILVTVVGNITVLLAFGLERTIRQPTNYFLASLAVSDLLIGTFSMPLYTQYLLIGAWPLGPWLCDLWLSLDWTVCLTSQYTVFLITMDRFLSVKIPAKYRNWRTERKVMVMIAVTWILPAIVFFTSIIGWQYFVGQRTVKKRECEVQFMGDTMFTFLLTIGYFWITLIVMCILYGGIYKVALDLQRKSDAKQKKLQSTMELAGEQPMNPTRGAGHDGSNNNSSSAGGDSQTPQHPPQQNNVKNVKVASNRMSVKAALPCPPGAQTIDTTSFSKGEKEEDRSSSPAFASDDDNSSSGGAVGTGKSPLSSGVYIGKASPGAGVVNNALFNNTGGLVRSLHGDLFFAPGMQAPEKQNLLQPPPPYSSILTTKSASEAGSDVDGFGQPEVDSVYSSSASDRLEKQTTPLLQNEIGRGCRFIDEKSFMAATLSSESAALLPVIAAESEVEDSDVADLNASSPIWKRRNSLPPIATDVFDIDDEMSNCFVTTDPTTTTTLSNLPMINNDRDFNDEHYSQDHAVPTVTADDMAKPVLETSPTNPANANNANNCSNPPTSDNNEDSSRSDTHCLSAIRRPRNKDTRLHSFVKSVRSRNSRRRNRRERKSKSENRARKALRTISFILGAFVLCWTPYHICLFVIALCSDCVNKYFYAFSYWLCYLNSPINPFCYAFANAQFKRTFLRIMRFDWHRT